VPADAPALAAFAARAFTDTYAPLDDAQEIADYVGEHFTGVAMAAVLADPACRTLLLEQGSGIVGYAVLRDRPPPAIVTGPAPVELWRFYLGTQVIGRGQGARLLSEVLDLARERGARTLWLSVYSRNARAIAFYERAGLRKMGAAEFLFGGRVYLDPIYAIELPAA
jgi:ribosomal protein S18 acetylase RimI-like enzyme